MDELNDQSKKIVQEAIVDVYNDYLKDTSIPENEQDAVKFTLQAISEMLLGGDNLEWHRHQVNLRSRGHLTSWDDEYDEEDYKEDDEELETVVFMIGGREVGRYSYPKN